MGANPNVDERVEQIAMGAASPEGHTSAYSVPLRFTRLVSEARAPVYSSAGAVGMDLCSVDECTISANGRALVSTGLQMEIPNGHYGRIAPRSGLAVKFGVDVGAGVVDPDYRGEVKILLFNLGTENFQVKKGDRIAQMILERCSIANVQEVNEGGLDGTVRGAGGFGSTGTGTD